MRAALTALLFAAVPLLAACGGDETPQTSAAAQTEAPRRRLRRLSRPER